jgi:hypothetical protein
MDKESLLIAGALCNALENEGIDISEFVDAQLANQIVEHVESLSDDEYEELMKVTAVELAKKYLQRVKESIQSTTTKGGM